MRERILKAIELLRGRKLSLDDPEIEHTPYYLVGEIYTNGNCANFAFALQQLLGGSVLTSEEINHYWLMYNGEHFDINGVSEHFESLYRDDLTQEVSLDTIEPSELNNYSPELRGPMV